MTVKIYSVVCMCWRTVFLKMPGDYFTPNDSLRRAKRHGHRVTQSVARLSCDAGAPHSAKSHARLACSVASALATVRCRYQLFAGSAPYGAKGKERSFYIEQFNIAVNFAAQKTPSQFCEGVLRSLRRSKVRFAFSFSQKSSIASPMPLQARVYFGALQKWWRHWRVLL